MEVIWEFIQAYWSWAVVGFAFLLMLRMHVGGHGGCGMEHGGHGDHSEPREARRRSTAGEATMDGAAGPPRPVAGRGGDSCH